MISQSFSKSGCQSHPPTRPEMCRPNSPLTTAAERAVRGADCDKVQKEGVSSMRPNASESLLRVPRSVACAPQASRSVFYNHSSRHGLLQPKNSTLQHPGIPCQSCPNHPRECNQGSRKPDPPWMRVRTLTHARLSVSRRILT